MSAHQSRHPIRKRQFQQRPPPYKLHTLPQLRVLAPAPPRHPVSPVQHRLQLEHNTQDEQDTEAPEPATTNNKLQNPATSQSYFSLDPDPTPFSHEFTLSSLLRPDSVVSSLERKRYAVVAARADIYPNSVPFPLADNSSALGNLLSGVVTRENHSCSAQHLRNGNLQAQETIQNQQSQGYWVPTPNTPENVVWTMVQPTTGAHQDQSSQYTINQHLSMFTQPLLAVQPVPHTPLPQHSQNVLCASCPSIWCFHLESITFSDPEDKGINSIRLSYRDLRQHIHEAHQSRYGAGCALCENLFCYHLGKIMLLEAEKGGPTAVKVDLGNSFMTLRQYIQEAHGGC